MCILDMQPLLGYSKRSLLKVLTQVVAMVESLQGALFRFKNPIQCLSRKKTDNICETASNVSRRWKSRLEWKEAILSSIEDEFYPAMLYHDYLTHYVVANGDFSLDGIFCYLHTISTSVVKY
ncbi:hypothetical protein PsorP6_007344 [Peronosclerospora sorghi]|uniref:Uncharacterized protein n=1 Tax=Peronosclerospora sorghi TaxID=230839 RepID=A0ACC0W9R5_9STRA|nr:hypothetical protein PsorP6_007344 [Peronosclerospora sorghi]